MATVDSSLSLPIDPPGQDAPANHLGTTPAEPMYATWQQALKDAVRDPLELCRLLNLSPQWAAAAGRVETSFPLFAPRSYVARMRARDPADPLLRQVLPLDAEAEDHPGFSRDPVADRRATLVPGLLHKYEGRVLMVTTGACAVHCRYCFRRHFPYHETPRTPAAWAKALEPIAADGSVHEVILSGGDPLTLIDSSLAALAQSVADIPHVRRLRVHTRLPIMIPQRVTGELLDWLTGTRLSPVMVIHVNHPAELQGAAAAAVRKITTAGIPTLNQAVLLRGVNDTVEILAELSERLVDLGAMPYYLHQLDRVSGAAHFEVPLHEGRRIVAELRRRLPGYAVPRYVREVAGKPYKVALAIAEWGTRNAQ